jgi:hypothetical protein
VKHKPDTDGSVTVGNALDRLRDERRQIEELFASYAAHHRSDAERTGESARLASLIFTLLRVHDALEQALLEPALAGHVGAHPSLAKAAARRLAVMQAVDCLELQPPDDPACAPRMATLGMLARAWFEVDETEVFTLARRMPLDLAALDRDLAARQEQLLSAGRAH